MGQRLNIEIYAGDEQLLYANCYYHWSSYTLSALCTAKSVIDNYYQIKDDYKDDLFLLAARCFEIPDESYDILKPENGELVGKIVPVTRYAGLCENSMRIMKFIYPNLDFHPAIDRNVGLISIHPKDISNTEIWEEGRLTLDLKSETFSFNIYCNGTKEDINDWFDEEFLKENEKSMTKMHEDMHNKFQSMEFKFSDIDELISFIGSSNCGAKFSKRGKPTMYYIWTE